MLSSGDILLLCDVLYHFVMQYCDALYYYMPLRLYVIIHCVVSY